MMYRKNWMNWKIFSRKKRFLKSPDLTTYKNGVGLTLNKNVNCEHCESRGKGIFCHLDSFSLSQIDENKVINTYKKGHTLFFQGNPPFGLYCVNKGKIKISKVGSDGKEFIIRIASSGDILGHRSLFSNEPYMANATILEEATICFIDKNFIYKAIKEKPNMALQLIQRLSKELGTAESLVSSMSQKNVRERLAELILMLKKTYGIEEDGRTRINIKLTREELASMIGTVSETIIRFITEFKEEGMITQEGKIIYVLDEKKLLEFSGMHY